MMHSLNEKRAIGIYNIIMLVHTVILIYLYNAQARNQRINFQCRHTHIHTATRPIGAALGIVSSYPTTLHNSSSSSSSSAAVAGI